MKHSSHKEQINALKRIEGQVRGIQGMIEEGRYCIDVLIQIRSVTKAISRVKEKILQKHLESCVADTLKGQSQVEKQEKINEVINILNKHCGG
ncbi:MAG: metal-sensitive transcriptional regulator [Candidatus Aceula meridiana]|nr:metal-sensitive transcriptional regulator [Candidatus Aceula meridiana]